MSEQPLYCINHPNTETGLRCNRCNDPICVRCAVQTPVGYRCRRCIQQQQDVFYSGTNLDYIIAVSISLPLAAGAAYIAFFLAWFVLILGPIFGAVFAEIVQIATGRRRSPYLRWLAAGSALLGTLVMILYQAAPLLNQGKGVSFGLVWNLVYLVLVVITVYNRIP